ncbi:MAG: alpha/beta hydrolase [Acidobacteria bacterium]|nr:alpha/beta hydrolase [Acidobacteriota bacterium]
MIEQRFDRGVHLRSAGTGERGTLLLIHGLGESGLAFEGLLRSPRLAPWKMLAPDLPGYGKSPWGAKTLSLEEVALAVGRWFAARPEGAVVVVGHSMGGVVGTLFCERFASEVRGLVNVEGNVSPGDCIFSSRIAAHPADTFETAALPGLLDSVYRAGLDDRPMRTYFASMSLADARQLHRHSVELTEISGTETLARHQAALGVPSIYLLGDPRGTGERSRALLEEAGVRWRAIPDAGHWVFLDQPELFEDELLAFLDTLD